MGRKKSLVECLSEVKDPRRKQGQRYSHLSLLLIVIMGILRGQYGYREIGRFCRAHQAYLIKQFGFRNGKVPSPVSIRTFVLSADFAAIQTAFHRWARGYVPIRAGEWIGVDGKSVRSTVSNYSNKYQDFVSLVSLFGGKRGQVLRAEKMENKTGNEARTVENLLETLDLRGVVLTMDALHCKKNAGKGHTKRQPLPGQGKKQPAPAEGGA